MAKQITIVDDTNPELTGAESRVFRFDNGQTVTRLDIDLVDDTHSEFLSLWEKFWTSKPMAKFVKAGTVTVTEKGTTGSDSDAAKVREWARGKGLTVNERGRLAQEIVDAYNAAHNAGVAAATTTDNADSDNTVAA